MSGKKEAPAATEATKAKKLHEKYSTRSPVGGGFSVEFRPRPDGHVDCVWCPRMPTRHEYRRSVSEAKYQAALMRYAVDRMGGSV